MLSGIGDSEVRVPSRVDAPSAAGDEVRTQQQAEEVRRARPVEKSESGQKPKTDDKQKQESSKYKLEETRIIFEKYNKNGDLIFRIPPAHKTVDQKA